MLKVDGIKMKRQRLKGGSLSGAYLMTPDVGSQFVRKEVSLVENREYGFQRWYSQLKRMQRYSQLFPGVFPDVIGVGKEEEMAYFDMVFIENARTGHEFLLNATSTEEVDIFFNALLEKAHSLYRTKIPSFESAFDLYIYEEIEQRLKDCEGSESFQSFIRHDEIILNGRSAPSFVKRLDQYKAMAKKYYKSPIETFTHGNLTLENLIYQPETQRVVFLDPYEENVIDSKLADYSQILQSCNSKYEILNEQTPVVVANEVKADLPVYEFHDYFNERFKSYMRETLSPEEIIVTGILEISQFIRMLPFKLAVDEDKMFLFYALASNLFNDLCKQVNGD